MNSLDDHSTRNEINRKLKITPGTTSILVTKDSRCEHCGDCIPKSNTESSQTSEFETIQLADIFTEVASPSNSSHQLVVSRENIENNNGHSPYEISPCFNCYQLNLQFAQHQQHSSIMVASESNISHTNSILDNGDQLKLKIDRHLLSNIQILETNGSNSLNGTQQYLNPNGINLYSNGNHSTVDSSLPVSIILPNGLDIRPNGDTDIGGSIGNDHDNVGGSSVRATPYACALCSKHFKNERLSTTHQDKHHSKLARYTCDACHGKFCYRGALNSHISTHHPQLAVYDCTTCGKTFKERSNLSAHNTIVHALNPRVFKCDICVSSFSKKVNLNYHRKRKHPELSPTTEITHPSSSPPPYPVTMEGNNNGNGIGLHHHIKTESGEGTQVELRESVYPSRVHSSPTEPVRSPAKDEGHQADGGETGAKSKSTRQEGDFVCQFCGRSFLFRNNLKCHLRTHIRDKKYTCTVCEKSFIYKESLKNHMLLHSNELPYQCDICMKKFRDRSNRRKHVKNVHKFLLTAGGPNVTLPAPVSGSGNDDGGTSTQLKRRKRAPAKKKVEPPLALPPLIPSSPPKGVILVTPTIKPPSPVYSTKTEVLSSPQGHSTYEESGRQSHLHHYHHLPPPPPSTISHPSVIVKLESPEVSYTSPSPGHPMEQVQQYYEGFEHQVDMGQYVMTSPHPQSISPEGNGGPYDSPGSPYVVNMSMIPPPGPGRNEAIPVPHPTSSHIHTIGQQYSSPSLYSSPLMGMTESGYQQYWTPVTSQNEPTSRPYYPTQVPLPTVTDGTLLNPQVTYDPNQGPQGGHPPQQGSTPQHNYFYTDLTQFDLSHL